MVTNRLLERGSMFRKLFQQPLDPREITASDAAVAYDQGSAVVVDVREPDEWSEGHLPGAVHIRLGDLAWRVDEVPVDRNIVTVCRSGRRSLDAVDILEAAGRERVKSMAGGMLEWKRNGFEIE